MDTGELDEPTVRVVDLVLSLARQITDELDALAREHGLTALQATALIRLNPPMAMHELATALSCDRSNVTNLVDRLEERDLVERRAEARDRRVKTVALTPTGVALHRELQRELYANLTGRTLASHELNEVEALLRRFRGN